MLKISRAWGILCIALLVGNANAQLEPDEGCTPGFWKNNVLAWSSIENIYPYSLLSSLGLSGFSELDGDATPLLDALSAKGGGENALMRHATAAYLNAAHPDVDYPLLPINIVDLVNPALDSDLPAIGKALKDVLDGFNDYGCPINAAGIVEEEEEEEEEPVIF